MLILNKNSTHKCSQCNSLLILVSQETVRLDGSLFPQTNSEYKCTNEACQKQKDLEKDKRMEQIQKKILSDQMRTENIHAKKREDQKSKATI